MKVLSEAVKTGRIKTIHGYKALDGRIPQADEAKLQANPIERSQFMLRINRERSWTCPDPPPQ